MSSDFGEVLGGIGVIVVITAIVLACTGVLPATVCFVLALFTVALLVMTYVAVNLFVTIHDRRCEKSIIGLHSWDGCRCLRCGKVRDKQHDWQDCRCVKCGHVRNRDHTWEGCFCSTCGAESHIWGEKTWIDKKVHRRMITPAVDGSDFGPAYDPGNWVTTVENVFEVKCVKCGRVNTVTEPTEST